VTLLQSETQAVENPVYTCQYNNSTAAALSS